MNPFCALLVVLAALGVSSHPELQKEIHVAKAVANGNYAVQGSFPFQVSIQFKRAPVQHICSGAILSDRWIITSAHCSQASPNPDDYKIVAGDIDFRAGTKYDVELMVTHDKFDPRANIKTVALWKTKTSIAFNDRVKAIAMEKEWTNKSGKDKLIASGWGSMFKDKVSQLMKYQEMYKVGDKGCEKFAWRGNMQKHFCVERKAGECETDLGSPITFDGKLHAIADVTKDCNDISKPTLINEMHVLLPWVEEVMKKR